MTDYHYLQIADKKAILEDEIRRNEADKYRLSTRAIVYKDVGDDDQYEKVIDSIAKITKVIDSLVSEKDKLSETDSYPDNE